MTQTEPNWTMESTEQLEDQQTKYIKIQRQTFKSQRQLIFQVIEEMEQLWEEVQRERKETNYLKTKTEQQQEEIDMLTAEKHERSLLIKRLRLQMENVIGKLKENINEATQEKNRLKKIYAEIYQERETLERIYDEIMNEQHKLEMIKYQKTKSHESKEPKEPIEQIKGGQEVMERLMTHSLLSLMNTNKKIILKSSHAKEQLEKNLAEIKQEFKRNKMDITQHRNQIEHIKHYMNLTVNRMKHIHRDVLMRKATDTEIKSRERQKEGKDNFEAMKIKLSRIQEGMEELWDVLGVETVGKKQQLEAETGQMESMKPDSQNQTQDIDVSIKITQWNKEMKCDIQSQKQELESKFAQVQSERNEIERIKTKIATERENIERDRHLAKAEMDAIKHLRESTERQKQELDDQLQRTKKEMRVMEVISSETEMKKIELLEMIRMSRRKKEEISMMKREIEAAKDMEERQDKTVGQRSEQDLQVNMQDRSDKQKISPGDKTRKIIQHEEYPFEEDFMETSTKKEVNSGMQRVILEVEEIRMMLRRVREGSEHSRRDNTEEKNRIKWMNFQAKKQKWVSDQQLEKTRHEKDELEIIKIKIQRQKEEVEKKLEDIIVTILRTMGGMKDNVEKDAAEINNAQVEMLKTQRKMEENKEEVKKHMDKVTSMKAQVSKWISTESAIKKACSVNISKQEPLKEIHRDSIKDQTFEILSNKYGTEDVFLRMQTEIHQDILMDDDQTELARKLREKVNVENQILKLKEREGKMREQIMYAMKYMEERNEEVKRLIIEINDLQSQRPETKTGLQNTIMETGDVEEIVPRLLKETDYEDILTVTPNVLKYEKQVQKEENDHMVRQELADKSDLRRLDVERQKQIQESREDQQIHPEEMDRVASKKDTGCADLQRLKAEIYRTQEIMRLVKLELEDQIEESNINKDHKDEDNAIEGLLEDIKQFQELLKMFVTEMRKCEMHLKEEMDNMKWMQTSEKKQRRELDQRLEKTLIERDELHILKSHIKKLNEVVGQKLEKMAKVKCTIEKMCKKSRKKSEVIEIILKDTKGKLRQLEDLNYTIEAAKKSIENSNLLISQERAELEKIKNEIRQQEHRKPVLENTERENRDLRKSVRTETDKEVKQMKKTRMAIEMEEMVNETVRLRSEKQKLEENMKLIMDRLDQKNSEIEQLQKSLREQVKKKTEREDIKMLKHNIQAEKENVRIARQQAEAEMYEMNRLRGSLARQKLELVHTDKREMRQMELVMTELERKKKESERLVRKSMRQKEESEIMWKKLREKELLRKDTAKRRRESDQRLEKTMRERDELEIMRIKDELADGKQSNQGKYTVVQVCTKHEKQGPVKQEVKCITEMAEIKLQSSKISNSVIDLQNMSQKINFHFEMIWGDFVNLENVNVHLENQIEEFNAVKAANTTVKDNLNRIKSQMKMNFEKMNVRLNAERDEMVHMWEDIRKQKQELEITLQNIKREIKAREVLRSELEIEKRENQKMIKKGLRKGWEIQNMWAEVKGEKNALKRETQKRKRALDQRLDGIIRERVELEIMTLKLEREQAKSNDGMEELESKEEKQFIKEEKNKLENTKPELQKDKEHADSLFHGIHREKNKIKDLTIQIQMKRDKLENIMNMMTLKQRDQDVLEDKFKRLREELQTSKTNLESEKQELKILRNDLHKKKDETEAAMNNISEEREKLNQTKISFDLDRHVFNKKKDQMKGELSDLKYREEQFMSNIQTLRRNLQILNEKASGSIKSKMSKLDQNHEGVQILSLGLEQHLEAFHQERDQMWIYMKLIQTEKDALRGFLSDMANQREQMESQETRHLLLEKQDIEKRKAELNQDWEDLNKVNEIMEKEKLDLELMRYNTQKQTDILEQQRQKLTGEKDKLENTKAELSEKKEHADGLFHEIHKEKTNIKDPTLQIEIQRDKLENVMNMTLKQKDQDLMEDVFKRSTEELQTSWKNVENERQQLEALRHDLNKRKDEIEAAMTNISGEKEKFTRMKTLLEREREMLLNEKDRTEDRLCELKMREDHQLNEMKSLYTVRVKLQQLNERMCEEMKNYMETMQHNIKDLQMMYTGSEQKMSELDEQKENLACYTEQLEREKEHLRSIVLDIVSQRENMENQWKIEFELEKDRREKLKSKLKLEREDPNRVNEMMEKDKLDLEQMRSNIQKQTDILEQQLQNMTEERDKLENTMAELHKKRQHADILFHEIHREKTNIKDLTLQIQMERRQLENVTNIMSLKQKDQDFMEDKFKRLTEELQTSKTNLESERQELKILRNDLHKKKDEIEVAMNNISEEREILNQTKISFDLDRQVLSKKKDQMKGELSELKYREEQFMSNIHTLRRNLQVLNEKASGNIKRKMSKLDENHEGVRILSLGLEQNLEAFYQERDQMWIYMKLIKTEKDALRGFLSDMDNQREQMESQETQHIHLEKQDIEEQKAKLHQDREDLNKANEMKEKEKLDLELVRYNIQKQIDVLEQQKQKITVERDKLENTKVELRKKKEHADSLFHEIQKEKTNIKDLTLQIQMESDKLQNVMNTMTLKQKHPMEDKFKRSTEELQTKRDNLETESQKLKALRNDLNKEKEEIKAAVNNISIEKEKISKMKTLLDREKEMHLNEKHRIEDKFCELKMREDHQLNKKKSIDTVRVQLEQLNETMCEEMKNNMETLQHKNEDLQMLYTVSEQKLSELDEQKENLACYTKQLEREKEGLRSIVSDTVSQRENMENQWKQGYELEKNRLEKLKSELKQEREDLNRVNTMMEKDKMNLGWMRCNIQKQTDILEQQLQNITEERDKLEITKIEQQSKKEMKDSTVDELNPDKQEAFQTLETELPEVKIRRFQLTSLRKSILCMSAKLVKLTQLTQEDFSKNMDSLEHTTIIILQLKSLLDLKCDELVKQKNKITGYSNLIQREKKHLLTKKFDKVVQTDNVVKKLLLQQGVQKQDFMEPHKDKCENDVLQSVDTIHTEEFEHYWKFEEDKCAILSEYAAEKDDFTDQDMSKTDCFQNMLKDTKMERKEIYQMKRRGYEMRTNLERKLKVINQYVKRTRLQKEKEPLEKTNLDHALSKYTASQGDCKRDCKSLDEKYTELQQLKVWMLGEIEKLHIKERLSGTLTTRDKADQTFQGGFTKEDITVQVTEQASIKMYQETEPAPESTSGLLCQIRQYCHRCCCPCCACSKQACPL